MARTDAMVLGAGTVGTSIALHLAKRGHERRAYRPRRCWRADLLRQRRHHRGQHGVPAGLSLGFGALLRVALKRATEANYHLSFLPQIAPWLLAFRAATRPNDLAEHARLIRPLYAQRCSRA